MPDHDPLCPLATITGSDPDLCPYCPVIAKVRADERAKGYRPTFGGLLMTGLGKPDNHPVAKSKIDERYGDLRAEIEALPPEHHYGVSPSCVSRADVLALIDGSDDDQA